MASSTPVSRSVAPARRVSAAIEGWFPDIARPFPWRKDRTAWRSFVSEVMLQQTQAGRIAEVFEAFMEAFPTPAAMAGASEEAVVERWKGLGFYRRARLLHRAAVAIERSHSGEVPTTVEALLALPAVGRYTAGAIASIVFGEPEAIVDGNIARVIARLDYFDGATGDPKLMRYSWSRAEALVKVARSPGVLNEGLMELGARVCTPRAPDCSRCPLKGLCRARRAGVAGSIPRPKARSVRRIIHHHAVALERSGSWLLTQRATTGHWGAMWELPSVESESALNDGDLLARLPIPVAKLRLVESFTHLLSHREIRFRIYRGTTRQRRGAWRTPKEIDDVAMSSAMRRAIQRRIAIQDEASRGSSVVSASS